MRCVNPKCKNEVSRYRPHSAQYCEDCAYEFLGKEVETRFTKVENHPLTLAVQNIGVAYEPL